MSRYVASLLSSDAAADLASAEECLSRLKFEKVQLNDESVWRATHVPGMLLAPARYIKLTEMNDPIDYVRLEAWLSRGNTEQAIGPGSGIAALPVKKLLEAEVLCLLMLTGDAVLVEKERQVVLLPEVLGAVRMPSVCAGCGRATERRVLHSWQATFRATRPGEYTRITQVTSSLRTPDVLLPICEECGQARQPFLPRVEIIPSDRSFAGLKGGSPYVVRLQARSTEFMTALLQSLPPYV